MKCNACWKDLEGRAVATTCGHIFCNEDAENISSSVDATCPLFEQMLPKSMTTVDMVPADDRINKCEQMQAAYSQKMGQVEEAYTAKLQQVHPGYQKAIKIMPGMEHERETMKDKKEVHEKYTEKSRQKRKLEEMYDTLRKEHELVKRSVAPSAPNNEAVVQRPNPHAFAPTFKGFDDVRHQPPGLSGSAAQPSDTSRNLLCSPSSRRHPGCRRG